MTRFGILPLALIAALLTPACGDPPPAGGPVGAAPDSARPAASGEPHARPPYDFAAPSAVFELAEELTEISALGMRPDGRLAAVHDEEGILYTIDPASGEVVGRRRFAGAGDFEGVEWAEGATWVLRSNGSLHAVPDTGGVVAEYNTPLRARCDAEGLGLDTVGRALIIMCKERGGGDRFAGLRTGFAFDLETRTLAPSPVLAIERAAVERGAEFKPSALAVHPATRDVYVLSSVYRAVVVLDMRGALRSVTPLPAELYAQPEGIAFAPDGTLFISNEGVGGPATLLRFDPPD